jgi:hypothetical protein
MPLAFLDREIFRFQFAPPVWIIFSPSATARSLKARTAKTALPAQRECEMLAVRHERIQI